ncbi:MAG: rhamnulokinase [Actinobacteria bacterium]|nr:rhamnulokinase [Actinomycetota bacterium]
MAVKNFLIFDFGASNGRASAAVFDGKKFNFEVLHRFDNIPVYATGTLYWDFLKLFSELKTGLLAAHKKYNRLESLGVDTWGVDFGLIDKNGKLISNPVHYRDEKRNSMTEEVFKIISREELFNLTGCAMASYYSIFNLYALKVTDSVEYINASRLLMMPDLFNYFLTGTAVNEFTIAHTTLLCSPSPGRWEFKIIDRLGFPREIFNEIVPSGSIVGNISKSVCDELEIKPFPVVAPAGHDTPSAIAGIPVADKSRFGAFMSIGTWGINVLEMDTPFISDEIFKSGFANEAGVESMTLLFKNFVGMWLFQQCRSKWLKEHTGDITWDDIMLEAKNTSSTGSMIDVDAPVFVLNQTDMPGTIRKFCSDTGQKVPESLGEVARIIYESMALKVRHNIGSLEKIAAKKFDYIHVVGGGTKDVLICQWIADSTGLPVFAGPTETTSVGNLLMQLKAAGEIKSLDEGRQISLNSSQVKNYNPENASYWDYLYERYLKVI